MKLINKIFITLAIILALALGIIYSGIIDPSAISPHSSLARWALSKTMHVSVKRRASKIEVPEFTDEMRLAGANDFNSMCAGCHGAPGQEPEAMGKGLNPAPPDLAESAEQATAAELFWVTKNGVKMTGMPAWGETHDDASIWPVVAFITTLPDLDAEAYQDFSVQAQGIGHHVADEHDFSSKIAPADEGAEAQPHQDDGHDH